jgi:hypothetical protein
MVAQQQPPQPQAGYPQPQNPQQPYYPPPPTSSKAVISLVLGVLAFIMCGPFTSIPGIIFAKSELDAIKAGQIPPTNLQLAQIAFWMNIAITAMWVIGICIFMAFFGGLGVLGGLGAMTS